MQKNKENYQKLLLKKIDEIKSNNEKPSLLLHVCCAPCSSACLDILKDWFDVTLLFYNPNIQPKEEYLKRQEELKQFVVEINEENTDKIKSGLLKEIKILDVEYDPDEFFQVAKGLENEKEGGKRCKKCFELRLAKTADMCKKCGFDYFTTTLTLSPYKDSQLLNEIGKMMQERFNKQYLFSDFKKNEGYKKSIEYSKKYNLYRQDYCGCVFSKIEREKQKIQKELNN